MSSCCPRRVQPVLVKQRAPSSADRNQEKRVCSSPLSQLMGAAPGCTSMWQCRLGVSALWGFLKLRRKSFSKKPRVNFPRGRRKKNTAHVTKKKRVLFPFKEKAPAWEWKQEKVSLSEHEGRAEETLDNILQFLWHSSVDPVTVAPAAAIALLTRWHVFHCWQEMSLLLSSVLCGRSGASLAWAAGTRRKGRRMFLRYTTRGSLSPSVMDSTWPAWSRVFPLWSS